MNSDLNPYAPPAPGSESAGLGGPIALHREGDALVVPVLGAVLPKRCVRCNAPAEHRLKRRLFWHPPGWFLLILVSVLVYAIAALIVRKKAELYVHLCDRHHALRRIGIAVGWIGSIACVVGAFALIESAPGTAVLLFFLMFVPLVAGFMLVNVVTAKRIDKERAWLKVGRPFLDSL
jgi:hypothetical protein